MVHIYVQITSNAYIILSLYVMEGWKRGTKCMSQCYKILHCMAHNALSVQHKGMGGSGMALFY